MEWVIIVGGKEVAMGESTMFLLRSDPTHIMEWTNANLTRAWKSFYARMREADLIDPYLLTKVRLAELPTKLWIFLTDKPMLTEEAVVKWRVLARARESLRLGLNPSDIICPIITIPKLSMRQFLLSRTVEMLTMGNIHFLGLLEVSFQTKKLHLTASSSLPPRTGDLKHTFRAKPTIPTMEEAI